MEALRRAVGTRWTRGRAGPGTAAVLLTAVLTGTSGPVGTTPVGTGPAGTAPARIGPVAPVAEAMVTLKPDPRYRGDAFEGWGTSLAWFAEATGGYPDEIRNRLADLLFGPDGLNLNIARFNIGGGNAPDVTGYMRVGSAVPGWWRAPAGTTHADKDWWNPDDPAAWNRDADPNQRWWIDRIKHRITRWEAFSNSPPYFQTVSGYVSGGFDPGLDQIRADTVPAFATYLVRVTRQLEREHGIRIATLDPLNEPNTTFWRTTLGPDGLPTGGRQEGAHAGTALQQTVIRAVAAELAAEHSRTTVSAMDETNPGVFLTDWNAYAPDVRSAISRLNVHTYGTAQRTAVRDVAKGAGKPLWMSEVEGTWGPGQSFTSMLPGLGIAQLIVDDLRELEPTAFAFWQPVENYTLTRPSGTSPGSNWGSVQLPFECTAQDTLASCPIRTNTKFDTIRNFTHYLRPGDHLLKTGDPSGIAAISDSGRLTVVYVNSATTQRGVRLDLSRFRPMPGATVTPVTSSAAGPLVGGTPVHVTDGAAVLDVPAQSVTTFVLHGTAVADPAQALIRPGHVYRLRGVQSGRSLTPAAATGSAGLVLATDAVGDPAQQWTLHALGRPCGDRTRYLIGTAAGDRRLALVDGKLTVAPTADRSTAPGVTAPDPTAQWILSTTGDGTYTLVDAATGRLVDVTGQATADGSPVGSYPPNSGANQRWQLLDETP